MYFEVPVVLFENIGGQRGFVDAGEVAESEDLFDLFGEQPLEVHFDENYIIRLKSDQL